MIDLRNLETKRAVGYCLYPECDDYAKGVFTLGAGNRFYCPRCRTEGGLEKERGEFKNDSSMYGEVRVHADFDIMINSYHLLAIVKEDGASLETNVYTLYSPLIKTEKRAMQTAERLLACLQYHNDNYSNPSAREFIISFDEPLSKLKTDLNYYLLRRNR